MGRGERIEHINKQLEDVVHQLDEARIEKDENIHQRKNREIVEKLKQYFPGVYDRLVNLCQPIHRRLVFLCTTLVFLCSWCNFVLLSWYKDNKKFRSEVAGIVCKRNYGIIMDTQ